jgi:sulfonate transport system permease protein
MNRVTSIDSRHARAGLTTVVGLALWQLLATVWLRKLGVLAPPVDIVRYLASNLGLIWRATLATAGPAAVGYLIGNAVAVSLALLFELLQPLEPFGMRLAITASNLPLLAIAPILLVLYSLDTTREILAALSVFFPMMVMTLVGLRSALNAERDVVLAFGGTRWTVLHRVQIPRAVPTMLTGLQAGVPAALLGAILAEFLGGNRGLGVLMIEALSQLNLAATWGVTVVVTGLSLLGFWLVGRTRTLLVPWAPHRGTPVMR